MSDPIFISFCSVNTINDSSWDSGNIVTNNQRIATTFNSYFASVFNSNPSDTASVPNTTETHIYNLPDFKISTDEVPKALQSLKYNKIQQEGGGGLVDQVVSVGSDRC